MNVKELIERLSELDPELRVVVRGYEGGYTDVNVDADEKFDLALNVNSEEWYYGEHEDIDYYHGSKEDVEVVKAICL